MLNHRKPRLPLSVVHLYRALFRLFSSPFRFDQHISLLVALLVTICGCVQLPDYAAPVIQTSKDPAAPYFSYRPLTQMDFRAPALTGPSPEMQAHFNARSSIQIRPKPSTKIAVRASMLGDAPVFFADIENLAVEAVFIPDHSWWNPKVPPEKQPYVLQHEQIHFALMELTARKINREQHQAGHDLPIIGNSPQEAQALAVARINTIIAAYHEEILAQHTDFDTDTSAQYAPEIQQRWWNEVSRQLLQHPPN